MKKWFYTTWVGNLYFEFLLWYDRTFHKHVLEPGMSPRVIRQQENSSYREGILKVKKNINNLKAAINADSITEVLDETENLIEFADDGPNKVTESLKQAWVFKDRDIKNDLDMAKMIEKRIDDHKELWQHKKSRDLLRAIRKAKIAKDVELADKLHKEWLALNGRN